MASWLLSAFAIVFAGQTTDCTVLNFTSANCGPCQQIKPAVEQLQRVGWKIQSIDVARDRRLAELYNVQNLPTVIFLAGEREVDRLVGAVPAEILHKRASRVAARAGMSPGTEPNAREQQTRSDFQGEPPQYSSVNTQRQPFASAASLASADSRTPPAEIQSRQTAEVSQSTLTFRGQSPGRTLPDARNFQVAPASFATPTILLDEAITKAEAATVRIRVDEPETTAFGTGTIVDVHDSEALVLTCGHLFRNMTPGSQLTIDLFTPNGPMTLPAQLVDFTADNEDIGLISFHAPFPIQPVPLLPAGESVVSGQPVFSFGCDHGDDPTRRDTQVSSINRFLGPANIEIQGAPAVGRSGGGLFDRQGRLIGVCNAAVPSDNEGIYAAADVVYAQIKRLGLTHLFEQAASHVTSGSSPTAVSNTLASAQLSNQPTPIRPQGNWPSGAEVDQAVQLATSTGASPPEGLSQAEQLICIVKDASGAERVVTIDRPDPALLSSIEQHSRR